MKGLMVDQTMNDIQTRVERPTKLVHQEISSERLVEVNPDIGDDTRREVEENEGNLKTVEIWQLDEQICSMMDQTCFTLKGAERA